MKRRNPAMPVLLVNPSNPRRGRRRHRRSTRRRANPGRRSRRYARRRNPSSPWGSSLMATALGVVGGALAFGADWGTEKIPVGPWPQAAILGGGGLVLSVGLAKWLSIPLGAGVAGGAAASVGRRIRDILTVGAAAEVPLSPAAAALIAGRESGWSAASMMGNPLMGDRQSFRRAVEAGAIVPAIRRPAEAGASRYIPGPVSSYGPNSWVYGGAGVVKRYVSSHNR